VELSETKSKLDALGITVAVITYDSEETNLRFAQKFKSAYPILSDSKSVHVNAFGILNESYAKDHYAYGTPHPGIFVVDRDGVVFGKFAVEDYRERPPMQLVLDSVAEMLEIH
jgi:peroxiredoxin